MTIRLMIIGILFVGISFSCKDEKQQHTEIENNKSQKQPVRKQAFTEYGSDLGPVFSPNGKEIAFYSYLKSDASVGRIFIADMKDSQIRLLSSRDSTGMHTEPKWSPDGKKIGYTSFLEKGSKIMAIDSKGESLYELISISDNGYHMFSAWDSHSEGYYFFHWPEGGFEPDAYYAKGSELVRLTNDGISCRPQLASDGSLYVSKIVDLENNVFDKYQIDLESKEAVKIAELEGFDISGNHFIKTDEHEEGTAIILEDLRGNDLRTLGIVPYKGIMFPNVDPDQKFMVFNTSFEDGAEIQLLEIETGKISKITSND